MSAMLVFDPDAEESDNVEAMTAALENVTTMQVTYAARDSDFDGHNIHAGEYLALYGSSLFGNGTDLEDLLHKLAHEVSDKEFITIFYGADTDAEHAAAAESIFAEECPEAEISVLNGGQPVYYYLISAE